MAARWLFVVAVVWDGRSTTVGVAVAARARQFGWLRNAALIWHRPSPQPECRMRITPLAQPPRGPRLSGLGLPPREAKSVATPQWAHKKPTCCTICLGALPGASRGVGPPGGPAESPKCSRTLLSSPLLHVTAIHQKTAVCLSALTVHMLVSPQLAACGGHPSRKRATPACP